LRAPDLASQPARRSKKRRHGWRWVLGFFLVALPLALIAAVLAFYAVWAQTFDLKRVGTMPERNTVFDVNGKIYSRLAGANRLKVSLKEVSPLFSRRSSYARTRAFTNTAGLTGAEWREPFTATLEAARQGRREQHHAATRTQQSAVRRRTISRKLLEAMVALRIERELTKDQILELYVNRIYFGSGCYGVETASQSYFGKNASKLDLSESALLAGLIRSPKPFFAPQESEGLRGAARYGARSVAGVEKDHRHPGTGGKEREDQFASRGVAA
jgi:penicillin-binding protein 1A